MIAAINLFVKGPNGTLSVRTKGLDSGFDNVVIMCQGANICGQTGYDFNFIGGKDYSTMDGLVTRGLGTVTFALSGYEKSDPPVDPLAFDTDAAIGDLSAVIEWVREHGYSRPHLLGWSWGGRIVGRYVEQNPTRIDRLILLDPALGGGDKILPAPTEPWWANTREDYMNRMQPEFTDEDARRAFADMVMVHDAKAPNGIRVENARGSIAVNPAAISRPTLMLYGIAAAQQNYMRGSEPRAAFFERLATDQKALVIVPDGGDYAHIQHPRRLCQKLIAEFLLQ
jgi:pimeloyl-ACP methyl ester carboxylesterase